MVRQYDISWFRYIYKAEIFLTMRYKLDVFSMEKNMTMMELLSLMQGIEQQVSEDQKQYEGNKIMNGLVQIRDVLNLMTLHERK